MLPKTPSVNRKSVGISLYQDPNPQKQKTAVQLFNDEFIAFASDVRCIAQSASEFVVKTAVWYYKQAKRKPYIWKHNELFSKRSMHAINTSLLKEKKRLGLVLDMYAFLTMCRISEYKVTFYTVGDFGIFHVRNGIVQKNYSPHEHNFDERSVLGEKDTVSVHMVSTEFVKNDLYILASEGIAKWVTFQDIEESLEYNTEHGNQLLFDRATAYGSQDTKTIVSIQL